MYDPPRRDKQAFEIKGTNNWGQGDHDGQYREGKFFSLEDWFRQLKCLCLMNKMERSLYHFGYHIDYNYVICFWFSKLNWGMGYFGGVQILVWIYLYY